MSNNDLSHDSILLFAMMFVGIALISAYAFSKNQLNNITKVDASSPLENSLVGILVLGVSFVVCSLSTFACEKSSSSNVSLKTYMIFVLFISIVGITLYLFASNDSSLKNADNRKAADKIKKSLFYLVLIPSIVALFISLFYFGYQRELSKGKDSKRELSKGKDSKRELSKGKDSKRELSKEKDSSPGFKF
jgi:hypothetical protein